MKVLALAKGTSAFVARNWIAFTVCALVTAAFGAHAALSRRVHLAVLLPVGLLIGFGVGAWIQHAIKPALKLSLTRLALVAYTPIAIALLAWLLARADARAASSGNLDYFFSASVALIGLLLIPIMSELRQLVEHDPWLRAFRSFWFLFIAAGLLYAVVGLTPGQSRKSEENAYEDTWIALATAVSALTVVTIRKPGPTGDPGEILHAAKTVASLTASCPMTTAAEESSATRTPAPATPASRRVGPR
jgi:hypothetical protein